MEAAADRLEELRELIWGMLDGELPAPEMERLEKSLLEDQEAREVYIQCVQLHAGLHFMFQEKSSAATGVLSGAELTNRLAETLAVEDTAKKSTAAPKMPAPLQPVTSPLGFLQSGMPLQH